jgi:hypothetical protein
VVGHGRELYLVRLDLMFDILSFLFSRSSSKRNSYMWRKFNKRINRRIIGYNW